jgi:hypothetical protein
MIQGENEYVNRSKTNKIDGNVVARLPSETTAVAPIEGLFLLSPSCFGLQGNIRAAFGSFIDTQVPMGRDVTELEQQTGGAIK